MACTETARIELHEKLLSAIGNQVIKQKMEIDLMHSTIHELGNTVLKQCEEHVRVRADNHENTELLRRAFGFPCAGSTKLAPLTQLAPITQLAPLKQSLIDMACMTDDIIKEGRASKVATNSEEYLVETRLFQAGYARPEVLKLHSAIPVTQTSQPILHYRTTSDGRVLHFNFIKIPDSGLRVICGNIPSDFDDYPRAKALSSLLLDRSFQSVEAFAVACENALGADIANASLDGKIVTDADVCTFREAFPTGA
jgi:hypothetical protein